MKHRRLFCLSLAAAILAAGCGGGPTPAAPAAMATVGGSVTGLPSGITILLVDNGTNTISANANGSFTFDKKVPASSVYNVTLFTQPTGASCQVANGAGTVNLHGDGITNISVSCAAGAIGLQNYNVGVTVSGLASGSTATFAQNGVDPLTANGNGLFVFPKTYAVQVAPAQGDYSVTVSANPTGQTCTLTNASGVNRPPTFQNFINVTAACK